MKVGFIGLGTMGSSMAHNTIQGGYELVVHDIQREAATSHLEAGAAWADTPREVAESTDIVFTSLPGPLEVEAVVLGEDGLHEGLSAGKAYFDLSTSSPTLIRKIVFIQPRIGVRLDEHYLPQRVRRQRWQGHRRR